ncbi:hypothetical protein SAMN04488540_109127 [Ferrimonas sediminum]|uniref:Uncharacterized protein n=1 Tax=Ferrimonas sediminum TaxID=718193 RepID=A0A1G8UL50_9GAMM|nr:hypothetical protein [Ferrimonas sediminum]SDJ54552.1 hypothetical protein SAMN04488540_109127 [Ferrimonas sediminum]
MDYVVFGRANETDADENFIGFHFEQFDVVADSAEDALEQAEAQMCSRLDSVNLLEHKEFLGFELTGLSQSDYLALKPEIESGEFDLFN